ncbi:YycH family regulatory protein [Paenibacillus thermoaerophilus]|uniref:YycH family regulatory protein n=1 Tax=Paenibacillus thermoaerophilus TaxID=1215385 RepID=A0ABW2V8L1_9BACL|nr:two-component system activity regulator YycH [Paenibacillus thermoaerophilus]TMV06614.1 hypothetical protein FE781_16700 [Paenibacillus thermoaerophilus]
MIERIKSALLFLLVVASLVQSYLIVFGSPRYEMIRRDEYVQTDLPGTRLAMEELVYPDQIVLHLGQDRHTVLQPGASSIFYKQVWEFVRQRTFDGFRRSPSVTGPLEWDEIRAKNKGIEIRFRAGIPFEVLGSLVRIQGDVDLNSGLIYKIWIYAAEERDEVRVAFFTQGGYALYEASKADINRDDVERLAAFGEYQPAYQYRAQDYYVPAEPLPMVRQRLPIKAYEIEQWKKSLFLDPAGTRTIPDMEGTDMYTDGKRVLRVRETKKWLVYSDPQPVTSKPNVVMENVRAAIGFVNQHGGWNGAYRAVRVPVEPETGRQTFEFVQYVDQYPIVSDQAEPFGTIRMSLQNGTVSAYERSTIYIPEDALRSRSPDLPREQADLPGGKALDERLAAYANKDRITALYPAYKPVIGDNAVDLVPVWAVELADGKTELLE